LAVDAAWGVFDTVTGLGAAGLDATGLATVSAFFLMPIFSRIVEKRPIINSFVVGLNRLKELVITSKNIIALTAKK
jgi:hypothetical protein